MTKSLVWELLNSTIFDDILKENLTVDLNEKMLMPEIIVIKESPLNF